MTVFINKDGYVSSPYIDDADIELEVTEEQYLKTNSFPFYKNWKYENGDFILVDIISDDILRARRERECFRFTDRGMLFYDSLSEEKLAELKAWRTAWLNVTETKVIPKRPEWLN